MTNTPDMGSRLGVLASRLAETLAQEEHAISMIKDVVQTMLTAIRESNSTSLAGGASILQERIRAAAELRQAQERQVALFFRLAGEDGNTLDQLLATLAQHSVSEDVQLDVALKLASIRTLAEETRLLVTAFEHALRFADQINHDLVYLLHGIIKPETGRTYTARGKTAAQKSQRSLLNQVG